ncbi:hypothetical protein K2173_010440 [Erythroxylum novogranatense]|uniref:RRM domain-containing protein n=1 Tax=Erythroxylum novogranatense TaxID=1862640 RepID=A0AAV8TFN4_9ROSI|nr:hypothetical protein K2173_010440 [Erythroxylum novogranatense]
MAFLSKVGNILTPASSKQINAKFASSRPSIFQVIKARVIMDHEIGRSRGFGFVNYTSSEKASNVIQALDGGNFGGNNSNAACGMYRSSESYDGNTSGDNYKSEENFGSYSSNPGQNVNYSSVGSTGAFDNSMRNFKVNGSSGDNSDNYASGGFGGGFDGNSGLGLGGGESSNIGEVAKGFNEDDSLESDVKNKPLEENYRDEDDDRDDFVKRVGELHQDVAFGG